MTPGRARDRTTGTLAERLAQGPLSLEFALDCAASLAKALSAIHEDGCAHGEVDPSLILLSESGTVLLPPTRECTHAAIRDDMAGFGAVLQALLAAAALAEKAPDRGASPGAEARTGRCSVFAAAGRLAAGCHDHPPDHSMQNAAVSLGLLSVLARQGGIESPAVSLPGRAAATRRAAASNARPASYAVDPKSFLASEDPERHLVPSQESCPKCGAHYVALSRPRGWLEAGMCRGGLAIRRCCICFHRYFKLLGIAFAKAPRS